VGSRGIALSPDGARLVVASDTSGTVRTWTVGSTGLPTSIAGSASLTGASGVAISPDGARAYVSGAAVVRAFVFTTSGALVQVGTDAATFSQTGGIVVSPDLPPTADIEVVPAYAGAETAFEGGHSSDPDGLPALWTWNFGDGKTAIGQHPMHAYASAGTYTVTLTVADNEGCSTALKWASQMAACSGGPSATITQSVTIADQPPPAQEIPPCIHDGNDGFCGTPDQKAPKATIAGVNDGASIAEIDAPDEIGGFITPDPSGIRSVTLKVTKAAGFKMATKLVAVKRCRRVKGSKKKRCSYVKRCRTVKGNKKCARVKTKKKVKTRIAVCDTIAPGKNYFVRKTCADVAPISIGGDVTFRYSYPAALGIGTYTLEVLVTDNAGNSDIPEEGRNEFTFKIVNTPSNQGGGGTVTPPTSTTPSEPITDTGSPFG
jgi:PKD repeat protein